MVPDNDIFLPFSKLLPGILKWFSFMDFLTASRTCSFKLCFSCKFLLFFFLNDSIKIVKGS